MAKARSSARKRKASEEAADATPESRPWWSTWPAVGAWFVLGCLAIFPAVVGWSLTAFYSIDNAAGIDMEVEQGAAPMPLRVLAALAIVGALLVPFFQARWARKMWLGYALLAAVILLAILLIGLFMFGIL